MVVGIPFESYSNEKRVALVPSFVPLLRKAGLEVLVQSGAGEQAGFDDNSYLGQGARLAVDQSELYSAADIILRVTGLDADTSDQEAMRNGQILIGLLNPYAVPEAVQKLAQKHVTSFALELLPRISRAQPMDVLSAMGTLAGYKAVLLGAAALNKIYPMMITAAGTITPSRVFVIGAGVAGLQAIATARRLGANVTAYDIRPAVKEQVESLEAKFLEDNLESEETETAGGYARAMGEDFYRRQREILLRAVADSDVVITTAAVPGKKAPILVTKKMVEQMRKGAVIVDLAAETGGNCELTRRGETIETHGITIIGPVNLPATIPYHASQMYAKNVTSFVQNLFKDGELRLNLDDDIIRSTLLTHAGEVANSQVQELLGRTAQTSASEERRVT